MLHRLTMTPEQTVLETRELSMPDSAYVRVGRYIDASTAGSFDYNVRVLEMSNVRYVVLDLRDCEHINSSGIECLVNLNARLPDSNGSLLLLRPLQPVIDSLNLMGVLEDFRVFDDVDQAEEYLHGIWKPAPDLE
jgi:anti-anti-sigma factor